MSDDFVMERVPAPHYDQDTLNIIRDEAHAWPDMSRIGSQIDAGDMRGYLLEMIAEVEYERDRAEASAREVERLRSALEWYADETHWDAEGVCGDIVSQYDEADFGRVALDALRSTAGTPVVERSDDSGAREGGDRG